MAQLGCVDYNPHLIKVYTDLLTSLGLVTFSRSFCCRIVLGLCLLDPRKELFLVCDCACTYASPVLYILLSSQAHNACVSTSSVMFIPFLL